MRIKNSNNTSSYKRSKTQKDKRTPKIIGLGLIKLDFYINFTEELIRANNIDLSKINSPKDLCFIAENPILMDLVQLSTTDNLINILLYLNKANIQKSFVELITLNPLKFKPQEEFLKKIFSHVTEHNFLFTNEMNIANTPNKISFAIKSGKKLLKYFDIVTDYDPLAEEFKKDENNFINKSINLDQKNIIEEEDEKNENDNKNLKTESHVNLSKKEINNFDEFENLENIESSKINLNEENENAISKNYNSYIEDYEALKVNQVYDNQDGNPEMGDDENMEKKIEVIRIVNIRRSDK